MISKPTSVNLGCLIVGEFTDDALTGEATTSPAERGPEGEQPPPEEMQAREVSVQLRVHREILDRLLRKRFGSVPEALQQRITVVDLATLQNALEQVVCIRSLAELRL